MMKSIGKKLLAMLLTAVLLMSMLSVTAFAAEPTSGPAQLPALYGGARCGIYSNTTHNEKYVVAYDYDEERVVVNNDAIAGMTYDQATNTVTVDNVNMPNDNLFIWYMGSDFKLNIVGDCAFGIIYVYDYFAFHNTSLSIIGSGALTVNQNKRNSEAIRMYATGSDRLMSLDIADSVTIHLYSAEKDGDENGDYYPVVTLSGTSVTPEQGGAITVGGKTFEEAQSEQIVSQVSDTVNAVIVENPGKDYVCGNQVKSKSDPDGVYVAGVMDGTVYLVSRYLYSEELGAWAIDYNFRDQMFNGKRYTKAEFEAEYEYIYGQAPTPIQFTTEWSYDNRGSEGIKIVKDGEPDAVYVGTVGWDDDEDNPSGYTLYRVIWSDDEDIYQEDTTFESRYISVGEMEESGYHVAKEEIEEKQEIEVWNSDNFSDPDGYHMTRYVLRRRSAPDDLFAEMGYYSADEVALGIFMFRVHFDPEAEDFYILDDAYGDSNEYFRESYENLQNDTGDFYYDVQTVNKPIKLRFTNRYFTPNSYLGNATQVSKDSEPQAVYAYTDWSHYEGDGEYSDWHTLFKLRYNESVGCYFNDESFRSFEFQDPAVLEEMGYRVVMSEQPLDFVIQGQVSRGAYDVYTDNDGNKYYTTYRNAYRFTDDDLVTLSGEQYHYGTLVPGVSRDDLNNTLHNVVTDNYRYWIDGPEYHHIAEASVYEEYPLWVNGEQLNSDRLRIPCGGVAIYDPSTKTLTLDNVEITHGIDKDGLYTGILSYIDHLTVVVQGNCTITETGGDGIGSYNSDMVEIGGVYYASPYNITVTGDGTLTIVESTAINGYGIYCTGNLVLDGVKLNITSASTGVWATSLEIRDTEADIHCTSRFSGIVVNRGDFTYENSTVTAVSDQGAGLLLGSDRVPSALTVSSGELSLKGKLGVQGIVDNSVVTVNGGTLTVEGSEAAFDAVYLADGAKNIIMGEGIGVTDGAPDQTYVVISTATSSVTLLGDADGDGKVSVLDATAIQKVKASMTVAGFNEVAANVDGDSSVSVLDATYIQKWLAHIDIPYAIGEPIG
ncbi:MAG: hypothetical protein IJH32_00815 [Ruminococcus sp.]|nr:hypothetical protein [Ruminococcus sp.]